MTYGVGGPWWTALAAYRVCHLAGAGRELLDLALDPLPADAPAVLWYEPAVGLDAAGQVSRLIEAADRAAVTLFPRWLPGADRLDGPGVLSVEAARVLAARAASRSARFGPFLVELAERACRAAAGPDRGRRPAQARFPAEVRAAGLVRVLADACDRPSVALVVEVPDGLAPADEQALAAAVEWFAQHGSCAVWLAGPELRAVDRIRSVRITLPDAVTRLAAPGQAASHRTAQDRATRPAAPAAPPPVGPRRSPADPDHRPPGRTRRPAGPEHQPAAQERRPAGPGDGPGGPVLRVPPRAGLPRADSAAEQALERALARHDWATGRRWNHTLTRHTLARPYRLDLFWPAEGLVVEVDGPEHRERLRYADDRRRDAQLQLLGHDVLRFTNDQVLSDVDAVLGIIRDLLAGRRAAGVRDEGTRHHVDR
ncbi:DUF559 domain-containing protein [Micromonospora sp. WMMD882]|uniref:DUF559 domain-containing protein n=1 Tax=Micromonospora sp. WMMD882 TaxID=3015151 RepID=UPI00248C626E|nr:DUF559 domain-containing protein [Micromonospora sp. WMMD882]WBB81070.1 DUF559 domain-containing protein [Micromonospora sp. WMMD882]